MAESKSNKVAKAKPDGNSKIRTTIIERSGTPADLKKAAQRLKSSKKPQKVLQVPQKDMDAAVEAMKNVGIGGTVKNISGSTSRSVRKPKS